MRRAISTTTCRTGVGMSQIMFSSLQGFFLLWLTLNTIFIVVHGSDNENDKLPRWDLESHFGYDSPFDPAIDDDVSEMATQAIAFRQRYEGKLSKPNNLVLLFSIKNYEELVEGLWGILEYLDLSTKVNMDNPDLFDRQDSVTQQINSIYGDNLDWFTIEVAELPQAIITANYAATPALSFYTSFLDGLKRQQSHVLAKDVERALTVRYPFTGVQPTVSYYEQERGLLEFDLGDGGAPVTLQELLSMCYDSNDAGLRAICFEILNNGLAGNFVRVAAHSLSIVAGSWMIENQERGFPTLRSPRNLANNIPDVVVDSMLQAVKTEGVALNKRYYTLKRNILFATQGLEKFNWSDRNAPIDFSDGTTEQEAITWEEAKYMVARAFNEFSPKMAALFQDIVSEDRIDVPAMDNKMGGTFTSAVNPTVGPFIMLNFVGIDDDVLALAHEAGHACQYILSYPKGYLQFYPDIPLSETASMLGETVVFYDLLLLAETKEDRLALLMRKIDNVVNAVVRQCSFDRFEYLAHTARQNGDLMADDLDNLWMQATAEYFGHAREDGGDSPFDSYDNSNHLWSTAAEFQETPFYVYSYALAELVVGALYKNYLETPDGFEDKLIALLSVGGTKDFVSAFTPFGFDLTDPLFWGESLNTYLGGLIAEAELLFDQLGFSATVTASTSSTSSSSSSTLSTTVPKPTIYVEPSTQIYIDPSTAGDIAKPSVFVDPPPDVTLVGYVP